METCRRVFFCLFFSGIIRKNVFIREDFMKLLIVVDMQNDFVTGSLGTKEAQAIVRGCCCQD